MRKVKVVSSKYSYWYHKHIGKIFNVSDFGDGIHFNCVENPYGVILKTDCIDATRELKLKRLLNDS